MSSSSKHPDKPHASRAAPGTVPYAETRDLQRALIAIPPRRDSLRCGPGDAGEPFTISNQENRGGGRVGRLSGSFSAAAGIGADTIACAKESKDGLAGRGWCEMGRDPCGVEMEMGMQESWGRSMSPSVFWIRQVPRAAPAFAFLAFFFVGGSFQDI